MGALALDRGHHAKGYRVVGHHQSSKRHERVAGQYWFGLHLISGDHYGSCMTITLSEELRRFIHANAPHPEAVQEPIRRLASLADPASLPTFQQILSDGSLDLGVRLSA